MDDINKHPKYVTPIPNESLFAPVINIPIIHYNAPHVASIKNDHLYGNFFKYVGALIKNDFYTKYISNHTKNVLK